ncbi:MAG: MmcQ/YjbR family DNA-binding protein [Leadbetterella sp.]
MNIEEAREYILSMEFSEESMPFGPDALVYKVGGKMFALVSIPHGKEWHISLKNYPERNESLREEYDWIQGAYHMNKKHWSMIEMSLSPSNQLVKTLILESYTIVRDSLPKKIKEEMSNGVL